MDGPAVAKAVVKIATLLGVFVLRELRRLAFWYLLLCELSFVGYTLFKLIHDGPAEVVRYWHHLQPESYSLEHMGDPFSLWQLFLGQSLMIVLIAPLWYFERRYQKRMKESR